MEEFKHIIGNTYYFDFRCRVGLYNDNGNVYLIDSGNDVNAAKKILKVIRENDWKLVMIVNTHHHADHTGGNAYLVKETGCKVYASNVIKPYLLNRELEVLTLWGAIPDTTHHNKFLMADSILESDIVSTCDIFELNDLPGHSVDMISVRTPDDVLFIGDILNEEELVSKYHITFLYDVKAILESMELLKSISAKYYVPAHIGALDNIDSLIDFNIKSINNIINILRELLVKPATYDDLLKRFFDYCGLVLNQIQALLITSTLKAYVKYLIDSGIVKYEYRDNYQYISLV